MTDPEPKQRDPLLGELLRTATIIVGGLAVIWALDTGAAGFQLQFAATYERAASVLADLSATEIRDLEIGLVIDFVVIAAYMTLFAGIAKSIPAIAKEVRPLYDR